MYLIGHMGNQFYPSSFRFFSTIDKVLSYLDGERLESIKKHTGTGHEDYIKELTKNLPHYIDRMSYRCYEYILDSDNECKNISKKELVKIAKQYTGQSN